MNTTSGFTSGNVSNESNVDNQTKVVIWPEVSPLWRLEYTILVVMVVSLAIIGVAGNISVLIVYFRRRDNLVSNTFIKVLACIDLLVCSFVMSYSIVYELHLVDSDIACRLCELVSHFCVFASSITLVAIAVERYIAVCQIGTKLNMNSISVGVWLIFGISLILASPALGIFAVVQDSEVKGISCRFPHKYAPERFCHFTYSVMGKTLVTAYQGLSVLIFLITLMIIAILYSVIYYVLWRKSKLRRNLVSQSNKLDSISEESCVEQHRPAKLARTTIHLDRSKKEASSSEINHETTIQNDDVSSEFITDNLVEKYDIHSDSRKSNDSVNGFRNDLAASNGRQIRRKIKFSVSAQSGRSERLKRKKYYHRRTAKMLFLCTLIYIVTWLPFWFDVFGFTNCLVLRYLFFIGNATNPIVYGVVNEQVRRAFKQLFLDFINKFKNYS